MARYVKYIGTSHWREITGKQWAALDPPVEQKTLRWEAANGWTLPADRISDDAWPYIDADPELVMVEKDYRSLESTEDSAPADVVSYPPLTTAAQADDLDAVAAQTQAEHDARAAEGRDVDGDEELSSQDANEYKPTEAEMDAHEAEKAAAAQNDLPDQESGSVEGPVNKD